MKIGVLNKLTNKTEYTYYYHRFKALGEPYNQSNYVQYEVIDPILEKYIWDEANQIVIVNPNYQTPTPNYTEIGKDRVRAAISYGLTLMIDFAGENVGMGITQAGKTKDVSDYLIDVTRYLQTGSMYEVMNEIDRLILAGIPVELSPFVTEARMNAFKAKIVAFLSGG